MATDQSSGGTGAGPSSWAWSNVWQSAKAAAEELSKKVADSAPQWQETAGSVMQQLGLTQNEVRTRVHVRSMDAVALLFSRLVLLPLL